MNLDDIKDHRLRSRIQAALDRASALKQSLREERMKSLVAINPHTDIFSDLLVKPKKRIQQKSKGPNMLEQAAMEYLKSQMPWLIYRFHSITFLLANGVRYTPDIVAYNKSSRSISCVEVKGKKMWDDSVVKLKVAAREWPCINWGLVWKEDGEWMSQTILP